ncbi:MAG TPA: rRNA methyltransferase [Bacteroidia bacterium]|nr:rRNA methyltransferase [Bacteroidia bacterium]
MNLPPDHKQALQAHLGNEFDDLVRAYETTGPVSIRINPLKWQGDVPAEKVKWCDNGYYLPERPSFTHDPLFHAGCYYVQEASSMFLSHVAKTVFPRDVALKVLDLSAAPGGKSTLLATELNEDSLLVANEVIRSRAHILAENISKWGKANVVVSNNDPEQFEKLKGFFDVIVVDAPCSGEGLFRRDPEAAKEWSPENVNLCSARQRRIVLDIWSALKEDGLLVYSTCTFNTQENEENLAWMRSQMQFESLKIDVPAEWGVVETTGDRRETGDAHASAPEPSLSSPDSHLPSIFGYRFYPHKVKGEGFFISVLRKTEPQEKSSHKEKVLFAPAPSKERNEVSSWMKNAEQFEFVRRGDHILAIPKQHAEDILRLSRTLHCVQYGIPVADAGKGMKPLHELALSVHLHKEAFHQTELSKEDALKFLAKVDFKVDTSHKGISLMTFQGAPLGWMNLLGNRANNLYPKEWRIRRL